MNITDYTGDRYDFRTYNCWHHVRRVRDDAGMQTPAFDVITPAAINDAFEAGHVDPKGMQRAHEPKNFDAVLMAERHAGRLVWHAGVYFGGMVSHCDRAARQVKLEALTDLTARYQRIEFWR